MAANEILALTEEGSSKAKVDEDTFSFKEWLSTSGLTALKDILIKHEMVTLSSLSTESEQFAAFISDPALLPRAMLIPLAIQSMQQLQQSHKANHPQRTSDGAVVEHQHPSQSQSPSSSSSTSSDGFIKTKDEMIAVQHLNLDKTSTGEELKNNDAEGTMDVDDGAEEDVTAADDRREQTGKHTKNVDSIASMASLASMEDEIVVDVNPSKMSKPATIKEDTEAKCDKKKRKMVKLKEGDCVKFVNSKKEKEKEREGVVRFIGETEFGDGVYYGVELISGEGDCDGSVDDVTYFECAANRGVFVKRRTLRRIAPKSQRPSRNNSMDSNGSVASYASDVSAYSDIDGASRRKKKKKQKDGKKNKKTTKRNLSKQVSLANATANASKNVSNSPAKKFRRSRTSRPVSMGAMDFSAMYSDRSSAKKKDDEYYKKARAELKKDGPREIGKIKYKGIDSKKKKKKKRTESDVDTENENEADELVGTGVGPKSTKKLAVEPKLGPREIGKIKYKGLKLSEQEKQALEGSAFLAENLSHKVRKRKKDGVSTSTTTLVEKKLGPKEIGKIRYHGTKLSEAEKEELRASSHVFEARLHHKVRKTRKHQRSKSLVGSKLGPQEIGTAKYKGTKMDPAMMEDENGGDILSEKTHVVTKKKWKIPRQGGFIDDDEDDDEDGNSGDSDHDGEQPHQHQQDSENENENENENDDSDEEALALRPRKRKKELKINKNASVIGRDQRRQSPRFTPTSTKTKTKALQKKKTQTIGSQSENNLQAANRPKTPKTTPKTRPKTPKKIHTPTKTMATAEKKQKRKKEKKTKKEKNKQTDIRPAKKNISKYKSKLHKRTASKLHYASESDQEYVESLRNSVVSSRGKDVDDADEADADVDDDLFQPNHGQKMEKFEILDPDYKDDSELQSKSNASNAVTSAKAPVLSQSTSDSPKQSAVHAKEEEIAHFVHEHDTSDDSDGSDENEGSLNALSSDEDDEAPKRKNETPTAQENKQWI